MKTKTLIATYHENAPFTFNILHTFAASPNPYRNKKTRKEVKDQTTHQTAIWQDQLLSIDELDDEDDREYHIGANSEWKKDYPGFSRNPLLVSSFDVLCLFSFTHIHAR
jgi:hypothetical protein